MWVSASLKIDALKHDKAMRSEGRVLRFGSFIAGQTKNYVHTLINDDEVRLKNGDRC